MISILNTSRKLAYEYMPYEMADPDDMTIVKEIPCYRIFPIAAPEEYIAETNEHLPDETQAVYAQLFNAAPELLEALQNLWAVCDANNYEVPMGYRNQVFTALAKARGKAA